MNSFIPLKKKSTSLKNKPNFDVASYAYQLTDGVDLMQIPGVNLGLVLTMMAEVGFDLSNFPTAKHFTSWLGLAPNVRKSGGKVLSSKTPKNRCRLGVAFRAAANSVGNQKQGALAHQFRRIGHRKGRKAAIMAIGRKIAIIVYNMLTKKQAYYEESEEEYLYKVRQQKISNIQRTINKLNISKEEFIFS